MNIFDEWKSLTRSFFSMRIALDREASFWGSLEINEPEGVSLKVARGNRTFAVTLTEHRASVADEHPLCAMALNLSYSLVEAFARTRLGLDRLEGGIEGWGTLLLNQVGRDWTNVLGGKAGLIEVAVARSAVAHGIDVTQTTVERFVGTGVGCPWKLGDPIRLTFETTQIYRDRLRSLLRTCAPKPKPTSPKPTKPRPKKLSAYRRKRQAKKAIKKALREKWRATQTKS